MEVKHKSYGVFLLPSNLINISSKKPVFPERGSQAAKKVPRSGSIREKYWFSGKKWTHPLFAVVRHHMFTRAMEFPLNRMKNTTCETMENVPFEI
ncbi:hypothetical protein CUU66_02015 [Peribacillus deserti]|uniref:Uncharacterized protein n=1 Tax=Peribacillus deserti TaxID=673318 RepID=A0A2N5MAZ8_9BACI|nr:hypothetical protein CUU66_02015 [Peribacillus deserti]